MTDADALDWLLVATKPRSETLARTHLENQGFRVCLPTVSLRKRRRGQWQSVTEPMFPGYVFVGVRLGHHDIAPIRSTIGCRQLVRFGGQLVPLPESVINCLSAFDAEPLTAAHTFQRGERVRIEDGPFAGLEAVFDLPRGEDRAQVLIEILGQQRPVLVDVASVGPG